jgi:hypothetical protein
MPNMTETIKLLNVILPHVIALWKRVREEAPDAPTLTDQQVIELLRQDSQNVVTTAEEWLAEHP